MLHVKFLPLYFPADEGFLPPMDGHKKAIFTDRLYAYLILNFLWKNS